MAPIPAPHTTCPASTESASPAGGFGVTANTFLCSAGHPDPPQNSGAAPGICSDPGGAQAGQGEGKPQLLQSVGQHRTTTGTSQTAEIFCYISLSTQRARAAASNCAPHTDPTWNELEGLEKHTRARAGFTPHRSSSDSQFRFPFSDSLPHKEPNQQHGTGSSMGDGHRACQGPAGWPQNWENTEIKAPLGCAAPPVHRSDPTKALPGSLQRWKATPGDSSRLRY